MHKCEVQKENEDLKIKNANLKIKISNLQDKIKELMKYLGKDTEQNEPESGRSIHSRRGPQPS